MDPQKPFWKPELTDWKSVDKDSLKFIFEQADKYAKYTVEVGNRVTDRAYALLLFLFPLLSLCTGALILPAVQALFKTVVLTGLFVIATGLIYCVYKLMRIVFPRLFVPYGRPPKILTTSQFLENPKWSKEQTQAFLYFSEITNCQEMIEKNEAQNTARINALKECMNLMIILFSSVIALCLVQLFTLP